jgi:DNA-binding transcriptional MerR regulator
LLKQNEKRLNNINSQFSIKDLENLSGIKAHTIRIWEKRYRILAPSRTDANIRYYDIKNLQKLLNVSLLYRAGKKISKVAKLDENQLQSAIHHHVIKGEGSAHFIDALKVSMLNFDQHLFETTYNKLLTQLSFRSIFIDVFIPLLHNIGLYWQSNSITPVHEHFISNLIKQKLLINIERIQPVLRGKMKDTYVLFLPMHEIHELGLLYIHYELALSGEHVIYLGPSVPLEHLTSLQTHYPKIQFISYFTVQPTEEEAGKYLSLFNSTLLKRKKDRLWILGRNTKNIHLPQHALQIRVFDNITQLAEEIN